MLGCLAFSPAVYGQDPAPDTTAPALTFNLPAIGATVTSRKVTISGNATDEVGVTEVRYRVERSRRWRKAVLTDAGGTDTDFTIIARLPRRSHARVYIRAIDAAGNESDTIGRKLIIRR